MLRALVVEELDRNHDGGITRHDRTPNPHLRQPELERAGGIPWSWLPRHQAEGRSQSSPGGVSREDGGGSPDGRAVLRAERQGGEKQEEKNREGHSQTRPMARNRVTAAEPAFRVMQLTCLGRFHHHNTLWHNDLHLLAEP